MVFEYLLLALLLTITGGAAYGISHYVLIFIHEMGHVVGCLLTGAKIHEFYIRSMGIIGDHELEAEVFGVRVVFSNHDKTMDGCVWHEPASDHWSELLIVILGPIFSLVSAIGLFVAKFCLISMTGSDFTKFLFVVVIMIPAIINALFIFIGSTVEGPDGEKIKGLVKILW